MKNKLIKARVAINGNNIYETEIVLVKQCFGFYIFR